MKVIAVTGSFGSGKTTVAKMFGALRMPVINADEIVSMLYKKKPVKKLLEKNFGKQIFSPNGKLDREKLARIVFSGKKFLRKLNALVHPLVLSEVEKKLRALENKKTQFVLVEVPLLFESRQKFPHDFAVVVKCSKQIQIERLLKKGFSKKDALSRINAQMPVGKKVLKADFVVDNSGNVAQAKMQVKKVFEQMVFS